MVTTETRFAMTKEPSMRRTGNTLWLAAGLIALLGWPSVAVAASTITGTVTFDGKAPLSGRSPWTPNPCA